MADMSAVAAAAADCGGTKYRSENSVADVGSIAHWSRRRLAEDIRWVDAGC